MGQHLDLEVPRRGSKFHQSSERGAPNTNYQKTKIVQIKAMTHREGFYNKTIVGSNHILPILGGCPDLANS